MNRFTTALALLVLVGCATSPQSPKQQLHQLAEEFYEQRLALDPLAATEAGDDRYNDRFTFEIRPQDIAARRALYEKYKAEVESIDPASLDDQGRITREIFLSNAERELSALQFPEHLLPIHQFGSVPAYFAQLGSGAGVHPFNTVRDYEDFLKRMSGFSEWVDAAIANMREGARVGVVQPRILIEKTIPQFEALSAPGPEESLFYTPIRNLPASFSEADRARLTSEYTRAIAETVTPAYRRLATYLRDEYLPHTRETISRSELANGAAWYRNLVRRHTTTDLTPEEIHQRGLAEVARIHAEMETVKQRVGFKGTLREFFEHVRTDPQHRYRDRDHVVSTFQEIKRLVDPQLPRLFDILPKSDYQVRPIAPFQEATAASNYQPASPDGMRPGVFWVNAYKPTERTNVGAQALSLHEGKPGHHFQISIQREQTHLPKFQRFDWHTPYVEGWGLYAESLGKDLGLFTDPYQDFGRLSSELWRSIRLVLDTGLHAKGWTRQQAIDYALANSGNTPHGVESEVDRFLAIPGQALAYKMGELEIKALRAEAERELGSRFDVREFHRQVLIEGSMPLRVLRAKLERWIEAEKR